MAASIIAALRHLPAADRSEADEDTDALQRIAAYAIHANTSAMKLALIDLNVVLRLKDEASKRTLP